MNKPGGYVDINQLQAETTLGEPAATVNGYTLATSIEVGNYPWDIHRIRAILVNRKAWGFPLPLLTPRVARDKLIAK